MGMMFALLHHPGPPPPKDLSIRESRHQSPMKHSRHFWWRRYVIIPEEGIARIRWRKLWHKPTLDLWEKINWHQTGKSLALGNLGMTVWSLQAKALYWTHSGILMAFSGDSEHQKVQTDLWLSNASPTGMARWLETVTSIPQVCRSAVRLLAALQIWLFQELHKQDSKWTLYLLKRNEAKGWSYSPPHSLYKVSYSRDGLK